MANINKFKVLNYDFNKKSKKEYDVLPYFRERWYDKKFNFDRKDVKTKEDLKKWIKRASSYQYWGRCEYEYLIAPWPLGSKKMFDKLQGIELNSDNHIKIANIIMEDMYKIDIHEQIMMNIDVINDILANEFHIN